MSWPAQHQQAHLGVATAGFAVGTAVLLGLRQLEAHAGTAARAPEAKGLPIRLLVAVGVDLLMDGILVGLSVATLGRAQGVGLTIALTLVIVPLALSVSGELFNRGAGVIKAMLFPPLLSLALVLRHRSGRRAWLCTRGAARRAPRLWPRGAAVPRRRGTARRGSRDR